MSAIAAVMSKKVTSLVPLFGAVLTLSYSSPGQTLPAHPSSVLANPTQPNSTELAQTRTSPPVPPLPEPLPTAQPPCCRGHRRAVTRTGR